jgi:iron(III) transport system substrate-binding protein
MQMTRRLAITSLPLLLLAAACGSDSEGASTTSPDGGSTPEAESVTLYTGRDEELVGPLLEQFTDETGIEVEVRYGNSAEMGAQLLEEGDGTPADVFYSQEVGAVGVLEQADLLADLPQETIDRVDPKFAPREGTKWVGVTGRSRVIIYNPELVDAAPEGVEELVEEQYAGQIGIAPSNAGFQAFVTAFRVSQGEDAAREWLEGILANDPVIFEGNTDILDAVNAGDVGLGLINHYYWARSLPELGDELVAELVFPEGEDPGGLVNATAAAITNQGADNPAAQELVDYLLSDAGQEYFVTETFEYPLVDGIAMPEGVPALDELGGPDIDLTDLESLEETQALLTELGLLT